ncbi:hypothetical protein CQ057_21230 [Ochrobactrum sp. MYb49]|nr:hypothetical protein CQ057_21230 [Ochrobactrum sp. MYb49]
MTEKYEKKIYLRLSSFLRRKINLTDSLLDKTCLAEDEIQSASREPCKRISKGKGRPKMKKRGVAGMLGRWFFYEPS